ncbi:anthranilate phosphoribosyltransferase [Sulfurivirga caldicuralii]|uniref:Anthranilate phosphoribosyltransferase n=1 Tax=Sulfurivirga caldicuralii TaxID=364032 RepID=A0A1N6GUU5_9GAMM|nr:anthranilate phosphoribosyltransferase [Sulfurivirga caldicuralii]SIO11344.1 anthranilate phosphoribosyltransferase [Sulfurivirga caldicuralii]
MNFKAILQKLLDRHDLHHDEMHALMQALMQGEATPAQIGAVLIALRMKGETPAEIAVAAEVMRELSARVPVRSVAHLVDTCGTGGDGVNTFNISTAVAFVAAAGGARVAKHGNRSVSSSTGSADVLEAAGVNLNLTPEEVAECIETVGVGFMFAPAHHSAMKHVIGPRRELGVRTIFNMLGPLTNPAGAPNQVVGVYDAELCDVFTEVLQRLGSAHVMAVHAEDGLDEISIASPTRVSELKSDTIKPWWIDPAEFDAAHESLEPLKVSSAEESLAMIRSAFAGETGPHADIIALNAGAALYVAGLAADYAEGVREARKVLASGAAQQKLDEFIQATQQFAS